MKNLFTFAIAAMFVAAPMTASAQDEVEEEDLTPDLFMNWAEPEAPVEAGYACEFHMGELTGMLIGNGNVDPVVYADLSEYDVLTVEVSEKAAEAAFPRPFFNRTAPDQQAGEEFDATLPVDFNKPWARDRYMTESGDAENGWIYTFNIKKIVEDYGFAYLHCIKVGNWSQLIADSMVLTKGGGTGITTTLKDAVEGKTVNLSGQTVGKNYKGIVIKNGKKFIQ